MATNASRRSSETAHEDNGPHPETLFTTITRASENTDPYLPYRTLSNNANIAEYMTETTSGVIPKRTVTKTGEKADYKLVTFTIDDPENPKNWPKWRKWVCTVTIALTCLVVALCSSVITAGVEQWQEEFGCNREVALLAITLFVMGFGIGPMVFAPLSEVIGRWPVYAGTLGVAVIFFIPQAVAQNIETLLVTRLIAGISMSAPMTLVGGSLADLWKTEERGVPMAFFSAAPFVGPALGPLIGGWLQLAGWRWLFWFQLIISGVIYVALITIVPETYAPSILTKRAKKLRKETGDMSYVTEEEIDRRPFGETMRVCLLRPFQLLAFELIVTLFSIYMSVLYGLLYMFFVAYPIVYKEGKGWSAGMEGLMFIPIAVGVMGSAACSPLVNMHYVKKSKPYIDAGKPVPPEVRLHPMMWSCWLIPIGLFIFAWCSQPTTHWAGSMMGGLPLGFGFIFLYNACNNYLVDTYQAQAASALAAKTFIRSFWGAVTVLFTTQMYHRLGYQWASSLLAFIALACCAIPYVFFFWGDRIRRHSRFAAVDPTDTPIGDAEKNAAH